MAKILSRKIVILYLLLLCHIFLRRIPQKLSNIESLHQSAECFQAKTEGFMSGDSWKLWGRFAYIVNKCAPTLDSVDLASFPNSDELKYHYMPVNQTRNCSVISLGIGKDVKAERKMQKVLPDCKFFGADPVAEDNEELFKEIGEFYNMAVGDKNGSFRTYVLEEVYRYQEATYVDLATFIKIYVKQNIVDQIMMDIEHAEYPVLSFFEERGSLEQQGIHVCQVNIEIHLPDADNLTTFTGFLQRNFISHQWIFINSEVHPILGHIRLFMVNGRNEECLRRYLQFTKSNVTS